MIDKDIISQLSAASASPEDCKKALGVDPDALTTYCIQMTLGMPKMREALPDEQATVASVMALAFLMGVQAARIHDAQEAEAA